jgi:hypothetical protein
MAEQLFQKPVLCVAEDRKSCEPALKLLLTSLNRYSADVPIVVFYPPAEQDFLDWVHNLNFAKLEVRTTPVPGAYGWNAKPQALMELLKEGRQEVIWIDSDILTTRYVLSSFKDLDRNVLVLTEEGLQGQNEHDAIRARMWGFPVKRRFPFPLNTGVIRVTQRHIPLLLRWKDLLESPAYREAQKLPMPRRPLHMFGDQDVLTALLSSEDFCHVPVNVLRRGRDIVQYYERFGFTLTERAICMMKGMPVFIHQMGWKPWLSAGEEELKGFRGKIIAAYQDTSPYTIAAIKLEPKINYDWMRPRSKLSSVLETIGFGHPSLTGLPIAIIFDLERLVKLPKQIIKKILLTVCPDAVAKLRAKRAEREAKRNASERS